MLSRTLAAFGLVLVLLAPIGCGSADPQSDSEAEDADEIVKSSLVETPLEPALASKVAALASALEGASSSTIVEVKAYEDRTARPSLTQVVRAVRTKLRYGKDFQVEGTLSPAERDAKFVEWGSEEDPSASAHRDLLAALQVGDPINENLWLSSEDAPPSASESEWADWVFVFHYPASRRVITVRLHYSA